MKQNILNKRTENDSPSGNGNADLSAERGESGNCMDLQEKITIMERLIDEYEEKKRANPDADIVFDVSKLPIDIEVMRAFVKAHEEVNKIISNN